MPVSTSNAISGPYVTNGVTTVFPFTFTAPEDSAVEVTTVPTTGGSETVVSTSDYTVSRTSGGGGSVTFTTAPATGSNLYVKLNPDFLQDVEFVEGAKILSSELNRGLDESVARDQYLLYHLGRKVGVPVGETGFEFAAAAQRADTLQAYDNNGAPTNITLADASIALVTQTRSGTAVGGETTLTFGSDALPDGFERVYVNGLRYFPGVDYTIANNVVTLTQALTAGDRWQIEGFVRGSADTADALRADLASTDSDKGGDLVGLTQGGTVQDAVNYYTPEMYGAVGDGTTDDTTALLALAASGNNVRFSEGKTYVLTGSFVTTALLVTGYGSTILHQPTADDTDCIECTSDYAVIAGLTAKNLGSTSSDKTTRDLFSMRGDRGVIRDCTAIGAFHDTRTDGSIGSSGAALMSIYNAFASTSSNFVQLKNCKAFDGFYTAFRFHESDQGRAVGGVARNGYRGYMISGDDVSVFSTTCKIEGIEFDQIIEMGGKIEVGCANSGVTGCTFTDCLNGLELGSGASHIFLSQAQHSYFTNNVIDCTNIDDGSEVLIRVGASGGNFGDYSVVSDNIIVNASAETTDTGYFGIYVLNCEGVRVQENTIENCEGNAVYLSSCENSVVTGNTIKSPGNRGIQWDNDVGGTFSTNTVESAGSDGYRCNEGTVGNTHTCTIVANTARNCGDRGFEFNRLQNSVILGNVESGSTGTGIYVQNSEHCQINQNIAKSYDLASNTNSNELNNITNAV